MAPDVGETPKQMDNVHECNINILESIPKQNHSRSPLTIRLKR